MAVIAVDFDGTLYRGNPLLAMIRVGKKHFTIKEWLIFSVGLVKTILIGLTEGKNAFRIEFFKSFARVFKGKDKAIIEQFFITLAEDGNSEIDEQLLRKIKSHIINGDSVIILSGALEPFLQTVVSRLGLEASVIGTKLDYDEKGICSGEMGPINHGQNKVDQLKNWLSVNEINNPELLAYADSKSDIPLFEFVQKPIVVNPSQEMRGIAEKRGWPIISH